MARQSKHKISYFDQYDNFITTSQIANNHSIAAQNINTVFLLPRQFHRHQPDSEQSLKLAVQAE